MSTETQKNNDDKLS